MQPEVGGVAASAPALSPQRLLLERLGLGQEEMPPSQRSCPMPAVPAAGPGGATIAPFPPAPSVCPLLPWELGWGGREGAASSPLAFPPTVLAPVSCPPLTQREGDLGGLGFPANVNVASESWQRWRPRPPPSPLFLGPPPPPLAVVLAPPTLLCLWALPAGAPVALSTWMMGWGQHPRGAGGLAGRWGGQEQPLHSCGGCSGTSHPHAPRPASQLGSGRPGLEAVLLPWRCLPSPRPRGHPPLLLQLSVSGDRSPPHRQPLPRGPGVSSKLSGSS